MYAPGAAPFCPPPLDPSGAPRTIAPTGRFLSQNRPVPGRVYLDHHATTPLRPEVLEAMLPWLTGLAANPSSVHAPGRAARRAVEDAREEVAQAIGALPEEIVFTSGGTESDALAVRGTALDARERDPARTSVVFSAAEHPAVREAARGLAPLGFTPVEVPVDRHGRPLPQELDRALGPQAAVASVLLAGNETGTLTGVAPLAALARARGVVFHTDAVQAVGKVSVDAGRLGVDLLSLGAHKLGGPKGSGALYARKGGRLFPLLAGGGQERGRRGGTENVAGIVGLAAALRVAVASLPAEAARLAALRDALEAGIRQRLPGVVVNGDTAGESSRLPSVSSVTFPGADGEALLAALDLEGIAASAGSACSAGTTAPSRVLLACGLTRAEARATLRFSLGWSSTAEDVSRLLEVLPALVARAGGPYPA